MDKKFVLEIKKGGAIIANIYRTVPFATPENVLFFSMAWASDLIYNYNLNLSNTTLPDVAFAIRAIQEENEAGSLSALKATFFTDSAIYLKDIYPSFLIHGINSNEADISDSQGIIAVTKDDMEFNRMNIDMQITIDFDNKMIDFNYYFTRLEYNSWEFLQDQDNIPKLEVCPYNFKEIVFNDLSDAKFFIGNNKHGFIAFDETENFVTIL